MCAIAVIELVAYVEDVRSEEGVVPVVKLVDLAKLYQEWLDRLEVNSVGGRVHTTQLKDKFLAEIPHLSTHFEGSGILLIFDEDVGGTLKQACTQDSDAALLAKEAQVVQRYMFKQQYAFKGSIGKGAQQAVVPASLLALVNMILNGSNIKHQSHLNSDLQQRKTCTPLYLIKHGHSTPLIGNEDPCPHQEQKHGVVSIQVWLLYVIRPPSPDYGLYDKWDLQAVSCSMIQSPTMDIKGTYRCVLVIDHNTSTKTVHPLPPPYT